MGAVAALFVRYGCSKWNDVDIPWHLMLFSAGAYALGVALIPQDLPASLVDALFKYYNITASTPFWVLYLGLTFVMLNLLVFCFNPGQCGQSSLCRWP